MSRELIQVPPVLLSPRVFTRAQSEGVLGIEPNHDHMLAIGQLTETGTDYLPDITVLRDNGPMGRWDVNYKDAKPEQHYLPASELDVASRGLQVVSAGGLRQHLADSGKRLVELTVRDWDRLGEELAESIEESKTLAFGRGGQVPDRIENALGWALSKLFSDPQLQSPRQLRVAQAAQLQPYTVRRSNT